MKYKSLAHLSREIHEKIILREFGEPPKGMRRATDHETSGEASDSGELHNVFKKYGYNKEPRNDADKELNRSWYKHPKGHDGMIYHNIDESYVDSDDGTTRHAKNPKELEKHLSDIHGPLKESKVDDTLDVGKWVPGPVGTAAGVGSAINNLTKGNYADAAEDAAGAAANFFGAKLVVKGATKVIRAAGRGMRTTGTASRIATTIPTQSTTDQTQNDSTPAPKELDDNKPDTSVSDTSQLMQQSKPFKTPKIFKESMDDIMAIVNLLPKQPKPAKSAYGAVKKFNKIEKDANPTADDAAKKFNRLMANQKRKDNASTTMKESKQPKKSLERKMQIQRKIIDEEILLEFFVRSLKKKKKKQETAVIINPTIKTTKDGEGV